MKSNPKRIVCLYSGGLDSAIMYHLAKKTYPEAEVISLYYRHGVAGEESEIASLPDFVEVRTIDWLDDRHPCLPKKNNLSGAIYIPGRNLVFSVLAASQEVADQVWMGGLWDEDYPDSTDKNSTFRELTSEVLTYVLSPFIDQVTVRTPFVELGWSKQDAAHWALNNGFSPDDITRTVSCYDANCGTACGNCMQCVKRVLVFKDNQLEENYRQDPRTSDFLKNLIREHLPKIRNHEFDSLSRDNLNFWYLWLKHYDSMSQEQQQSVGVIPLDERTELIISILQALDRPSVLSGKTAEEFLSLNTNATQR